MIDIYKGYCSCYHETTRLSIFLADAQRFFNQTIFCKETDDSHVDDNAVEDI